MRKFLLRMWEFVYPPYELSRDGGKRDSQPADPAATSRYAKKSVAPDVQQSHLAVAEAIYKSEIDRKKGIEDKAATFLPGVAIASSILIALPALLTEKISGPICLRVMVLFIFIIAVGYLIIAAIYAVKVRARAPHYIINSASLQSFALTDTHFRRQWASHLIDLVRRNEPLLLEKANHLYLAEKTFLRGMVVASIGGFLLGIFAIAYPRVQTIPSLTVDSGAEREIKVLAMSVVRCVDSNTNLYTQLSAERKALDELKAELAVILKANAELKAKLEAKQKAPKRHSSVPAHPVALRSDSQGCRPDPLSDVLPTPDKPVSPPS